MMRILCLHDEHSSATTVIKQLKDLGERLYKRHNIELVFANSPLLSEQIIDPSSNNDAKSADKERNDCAANDDLDDDLDNSLDDSLDDVKLEQRTWFLQDKVGLDASILHLRQIWCRSFYSKPFSGILGIGQGGAISSLLPFLRYEVDSDSICEEDGDGMVDSKLMFEGLRFCIMINAWDMTESSVEDEDDQAQVVDIPSLHIVPQHSEQSKTLYKFFGGDTSESLASLLEVPSSSSSVVRFDAKLYNVIGKFIVGQKKQLVLEQVGLFKLEKENDAQGNNDETVDDKHLVSVIESTRRSLAALEVQSIQLINSTIAADPPKALVAVVSPDDSRGGVMVGGWSGDRDAFRSEGFKESGGAPCPKDFVLPDSKRTQNKKQFKENS